MSSMEFRLLGPLEVRRDGDPVRLGGPRERAVLAALLLRANRLASTGYLVDAVWDRPPASPETNLRTYLTGLRRRLGAARFVTRPGGYLIEVPAAELDLARFEQAAGRGRAELEGGELGAAADSFRGALALWRDTPLVGETYGPTLRAEVARLSDRRIDAIEGYARARLGTGSAPDVVDQLTRFTEEFPLREELWALLIQALCRAGRQADALATYHRARAVLRDELAIEPGPGLRRLHKQILDNDPDVGQPVVAGRAEVPVPAQLPAGLRLFTGRTAEVRRLTELIVPNRPDLPEPAVVAIDGMPGVGKTALAVQVAHLVRDRFPDGQIFLDLHGYTDGIDPLGTSDALGRLLRTLGVAGRQIPTETDARAAAFRTTLQGRRMLIVLDNARSEQQVRPLLPAAPGCAVLVTSRHRLAMVEQAVPLSLSILPVDDAVELFTSITRPGSSTGKSDHSDEAGLVADIVDRCGRLPLAIRIAAARLRSRPTWSVRHLAERLQDEDRLLTELAVGERSVATAFTLSYRQLTEPQRQLLRRIGLSPGASVDRHSAAALADLDAAEADRLLEQLLDANLLLERAPGHYGLHDLLRSHVAADEISPADRRQALTRLLRFYLRCAVEARAVVQPTEPDPQPDVTGIDGPMPGFGLRSRADAWLANELPNLLAAAHYAAANGLPEYTVQLGMALAPYLRLRSLHDAALGLHSEGHACALRVKDRAGELVALRGLAEVHHQRSRPREAAAYYQDALDLGRSIGDDVGTAAALHGLGNLHQTQGRYDDARRCHLEVLEIAGRTGDRVAEARALHSLGNNAILLGDHALAGRRYRQSLAIARQLDDRLRQAQALDGLANVLQHTGDLAGAGDCYREAFTICRALGDRRGQEHALSGGASTRLRAGDVNGALDDYRQALGIAREIGHRSGEGQVLHGMARAYRTSGDIAAALRHDSEALEIARQTGDRNGQFEALHGLGLSDRAGNDPDRARDHHEQALRLAVDLGQRLDIGRAHEALADVHRALGDHVRAEDHASRAAAVLGPDPVQAAGRRRS